MYRRAHGPAGMDEKCTSPEFCRTLNRFNTQIQSSKDLFGTGHNTARRGRSAESAEVHKAPSFLCRSGDQPNRTLYAMMIELGAAKALRVGPAPACSRVARQQTCGLQARHSLRPFTGVLQRCRHSEVGSREVWRHPVLVGSTCAPSPAIATAAPTWLQALRHSFVHLAVSGSSAQQEAAQPDATKRASNRGSPPVGRPAVGQAAHSQPQPASGPGAPPASQHSMSSPSSDLEPAPDAPPLPHHSPVMVRSARPPSADAHSRGSCRSTALSDGACSL